MERKFIILTGDILGADWNSVKRLFDAETTLHKFPENEADSLLQVDRARSLVGAYLAEDSRYFIVTQSPYVVSTINNCILAYDRGQKSPEKVADILGREYWLPYEKVEAEWELIENTEPAHDPR